jgi:chemotaxis protein methyltransferase CheR
MSDLCTPVCDVTAPPPEREEDTLREIAALVQACCGLQLLPERLWLLERRVASRIRAGHYQSSLEYLRALQRPGGAAELDRLIEALRVGETQFFRQQAHLNALRRLALPELEQRRIAAGRNVLRAWSAGCATGEEPYSVAMVLAEWCRQRPGWSFQIIATDMSSEALGIARRASYAEEVVSGVPPALRERYLVRERPGEVRVTASLRRHVRFERHNLIQDAYPSELDLIFCRNVMIYFGGEDQRHVIERLSGSLLVHGYMFLGQGEALCTTDSCFRCIRSDDGLIYQRVDTGDRAVPGPEPRGPSGGAGSTAAKVAAAAPPPRETSSDARSPLVIRLTGSYAGENSTRLADELRPAITPTVQRPVIVDLDGATVLDDRAARVLRRIGATLVGTSGDLVLVAGRSAAGRWLERQPLLRHIRRLPTVQEAQEALRTLRRQEDEQ